MTRKGVRIVLGIVMMVSFLNLVFTINFFVGVASRLDSVFLVAVMVFGFNYLYMPCLVLIGLCYLLLTRVFKYQP